MGKKQIYLSFVFRSSWNRLTKRLAWLCSAPLRETLRLPHRSSVSLTKVSTAWDSNTNSAELSRSRDPSCREESFMKPNRNPKTRIFFLWKHRSHATLALAVRTLTQRSWLTSEATYSSSCRLLMTRFSSISVGIGFSPELNTSRFTVYSFAQEPYAAISIWTYNEFQLKIVKNIKYSRYCEFSGVCL